MSRPDVLAMPVAGLLSALLAWAAVSDMRVRRIPNLAVLGVLILVVPWLYATGLPVVPAVAAGLLALAVGYILFLFGVLGAGDAKLFSSLALCAGLAQLPELALATALTGGAIAGMYLLFRPRHALVFVQLRGKSGLGPSIPYGVAIAIGGAFILWSRVMAA